MSEPLLEVRGLDASYGDFQALFGVSIAIGAGEIVAIIGANGAGKSTLLNSIAGLVRSPRPDAITFEGAQIGGMPANAIAARGRRIASSLNRPTASRVRRPPEL